MRALRAPALHWQILIAIILAVGAGLALPKQLGGVDVVAVFDFIGTLFLRALQMLVVPLILTSVISSLAKAAGGAHAGRLGWKTALYYCTTGLAAIVTGLVVVNLIQPGRVAPDVSQALIASAQMDVQETGERLQNHGAADMAGILIRMVPENAFAAFTRNADMLSILFFAILVGIFSARLAEPGRSSFAQWWSSFFEVMMAITGWVLKFAPLGIFGLIGETVMTTGLAFIGPVAKFALCVVVALAFHLFVTLSLVLRAFGANPVLHLRTMAPALLTAFSSASSAATLPVTLRCLERRGVSERVRGFFIPVGANINTDGTALYECAAALFIAQVYGIEITPAVQFTIIALALLTSVGVAGVPAASLVAIVIILNAIGLPLEAIGLILATDRVLDMARTAVNVYGDSVGAAVIARSEGEELATS
ncbi:MAG: dicarboxylate/amino acid:cation symporter [Terrimicrobiaceae bacterium]|nr:dicarboxylate/amino acid:cation symporter [Terrimicrobiaceae bacterium]